MIHNDLPLLAGVARVMLMTMAAQPFMAGQRARLEAERAAVAARIKVIDEQLATLNNNG